MKIAHFVGHSLVRYTPGRIAAYWGRYTKHEGRAFALNRGVGWQFQEPLNPYGFYLTRGAPKAPLVDWVRDCDVLHFHDDSYPSQLVERFRVDLTGKTLVYHAHIGNIPQRYWGRGKRQRFPWWQNVRHAGITNGYGPLFDAHQKDWKGERIWGRLPDILDLDHPTYAPDERVRPAIDAEKLRVVYTYSNQKEDGKLNAKRPRGHLRLVRSTKAPVVPVFIYGRSFEESMAEKRRAHIVLEECFTPYLHLSALEGAAIGACVVTKYNDDTVRETSEAVGAPVDEWPFLYADESTLPDVLFDLDRNREKIREYGERGRRWMTTYYTAPKLLRRYLDFYGKSED